MTCAFFKGALKKFSFGINRKRKALIDSLKRSTALTQGYLKYMTVMNVKLQNNVQFVQVHKSQFLVEKVFEFKCARNVVLILTMTFRLWNIY
ncbi:hypothetical protein BpHYR1_012186 [Brachionus plicatilis]|uniref:Uncharacterized protein n=1 Tax=Brachionus plicatilis TaxID=10195 RepID=A0A3M7Q6K0_BRAPC|nr:hypothetical protein BpHYR1_012186 [Brachionus plicatilis]